MAIVNNLWLRSSKKRLAGTVIYQAMGQTRQRELAVEVSNPRTQAQMTQRVKWANLVAFYRANKYWMKYAYETKNRNQSEYNKLMSLNVSTSPIYLPKNVAAAGGCVCAPYIITQGSLPSIEMTDDSGQRWVSNIVLDNDYEMNSPSIADFSEMLIRLNPAIRQGDQLSFVRITQQTNGQTGVPYIVVREYELIIDVTAAGYVFDYLPQVYIDSTESATDCRLCVNNSGSAGGFALILSRTEGGKTYVSSQRVIVANNDALINAYSSNAALAAAIQSYGSSDNAFLSSNTAEEAQQAPTLMSVLSVYFGDTQVATGTRANGITITSTNTVRMIFNKNPAGTVANCRVVFWKEGQQHVQNYTGGSIVNNFVSFTPPQGMETFTDTTIESVSCTLDGVLYAAYFDLTSGGGLE